MTANLDLAGRSLREVATRIADRADKETRERDARKREEYAAYVLEAAHDYAVHVLGRPHADGAVWTLRDDQGDAARYGYGPDLATATIDGERFEHRCGTDIGIRDTLRHLLWCPSTLHPPAEMRSGPIRSLYELGVVLREAPQGYTCDACERIDAEQQAEHEKLEAEQTRAETELCVKYDEALGNAVKAADATVGAENVEWAQAYAMRSLAWSAIAEHLRDGAP